MKFLLTLALLFAAPVFAQGPVYSENAAIKGDGTQYEPLAVISNAAGLVDSQFYLKSSRVAGQIITDGSWSNTSSVLHSAGMAQWTSALVGDLVQRSYVAQV